MCADEIARCSQQWRASSHPAAGTAPVARFWVAVEQPGAWGRSALTQSGLDPVLGARLEQAVDAAGGRAVLVRRPEVRATERSGLRSVFIAGNLLRAPWLGRRDVPEGELDGVLDELIGYLPELADATRPPDGFRPAPPVLLLCTNGKRDRCCAIQTRPIAEAAAREAGAGRVWESSHLNGHRFAPTGVVLPTAQMFGWLTESLAVEALTQAESGRLLLPGERHERGRSALPRGVQAVDVALRTAIGESDPTALSFEGDAGGDAVDWVDREARVWVEHRDGRRWLFTVTARESRPLPESCGKHPVPVADWAVTNPTGEPWPSR